MEFCFSPHVRCEGQPQRSGYNHEERIIELENDGASKLGLRRSCTGPGFRAASIARISTFSSEYFSNSRTVVIENKFLPRICSSVPAAGRATRRNFQLHQQPILSGQTCLRRSFRECSDWFASSPRHDHLPGTSAS